MTIALWLLGVLLALMGVCWITLRAISRARIYLVRREIAKDSIPMTLERQRYLHDECHRQRRDVDQV